MTLCLRETELLLKMVGSLQKESEHLDRVYEIAKEYAPGKHPEKKEEAVTLQRDDLYKLVRLALFGIEVLKDLDIQINISLLEPEWVRDLIDMKEPFPEFLERWARGRPDSIKQVMREWPPTCIVRVKTSTCPSVPVGSYGQVRVYYENGDLGICLSPDEHDREIHDVLPEHLELIGFWNQLNKERIREILDGE